MKGLLGTGSVARTLGRVGAGALAAAIALSLAGVGQPPTGPGEPGRPPGGPGRDRPGAEQPAAPEKPGPKSIPVPEAMKKLGTV